LAQEHKDCAQQEDYGTAGCYDMQGEDALHGAGGVCDGHSYGLRGSGPQAGAFVVLTIKPE